MNESADQRKYEDFLEQDWSEESIRQLQKDDLAGVYACLPSIMYAATLSGTWKTQFAMELLASASDSAQRDRVWYGLMVCVRLSPQSDFENAANAAWELIDQFANDEPFNRELSRCQHFLDDLRIFRRNETDGSTYDRLKSRFASRFDVFTSTYCACSHGDIQEAGRLAIQLSAHPDFVLRESGIHGICTIYTRSDCNPNSLKSMRAEFARTLNEHKSDVHWFVRKTNETSCFFQEVFDGEFSITGQP